MISDILLGVFCIAIIANAYALFRYWQSMRAFTILMIKLEATQRQFNEIVQQRKSP